MRSIPDIPRQHVPDEPRLREAPTWRVSTIVLLAIPLALVVMIGPSLLGARMTTDPAGQAMIAGGLGFLGALGILIAWTVLLRVSPRALFVGPPSFAAIRYALLMVAIAGSLVSVPIAAGWVAPTLEYRGLGVTVRHLGAGLAVGMWTGTLEELLLRGFALSVLGHRWNWTGAIATTAILFGGLHIGAGGTALATGLYVILTTIAGLLFGVVTVATGSVWPAVGMHAVWNAIFSEFVVGIDPIGSVEPILSLQPVVTPSPVAVGGAALPESPLAIALLVISLGLVWTRLVATADDDHPS